VELVPKMSADLDATKRLMGALMRMKPKPHEQMKVGKSGASKVKGRRSALPALPPSQKPFSVLRPTQSGLGELFRLRSRMLAIKQP